MLIIKIPRLFIFTDFLKSSQYLKNGMIVTSVLSFYAAPGTPNETKEQIQGDKEVVQAAGM